MSNLNQIEARVNALVKATSSDDSFNDAYESIEEAGTDTPNNDLNRLKTILSTFRSKVPNRITLKRTRIDAKDLADTLLLASLAKRLERIELRNKALSNLGAALDEQIKKANADAGRLTSIQKKIDQATSTVNEIKTLISSLTATDATTKSRLKALVDALNNISGIFKPE